MTAGETDDRVPQSNDPNKITRTRADSDHASAENAHVDPLKRGRTIPESALGQGLIRIRSK